MGFMKDIMTCWVYRFGTALNYIALTTKSNLCMDQLRIIQVFASAQQNPECFLIIFLQECRMKKNLRNEKGD